MRLTGLKPYHYHVETLNLHPGLLNIGGKAQGQLLLTGLSTSLRPLFARQAIQAVVRNRNSLRYGFEFTGMDLTEEMRDWMR